MPTRESIVGGGPGSRGFWLRHVGPKAQIWNTPSVSVATYAVLNQTQMVARPLTMGDQTTTAGWSTAQLTTRFGDAGQGQVNFPNAKELQPADGPPWNSRFDAGQAGLRNQWIEIWNEADLEQVFCIYTVVPDFQQVQITGFDGFYLTKNAYERDWLVTQAPRDVFERGTQLWTPVVVDNFPMTSVLNGTAHTITTPTTTWSYNTGSGTFALGALGNVIITPSSTPGLTAVMASPTITVPATGIWAAEVTIPSYIQASNSSAGVGFIVEESSGDLYTIILNAGQGQLEVKTGSTIYQVSSMLPQASSWTLRIESDGQWAWGYINGALIGEAVLRQHATTTTLQVGVQGFGGSSPSPATISSVMLEMQQSYLMRGTDKGDYVLPGTAATYPYGGLHARYFTDTNLQSDPGRLQKVLNPTRWQAYAGSNPLEYVDQQENGLLGQSNPAGAAATNWSCKWFGAVYLKLSQGDYTFTLTFTTVSGAHCAGRVWVGQTTFGTQIIDAWNYSSGAQNHAGTASATTLAGTLPNGGGTVARDGWYPIVIDFSADAGVASISAPFLSFTPPVSYTDPGGTSLTGGVSRNVPSTSFSPDGCIDNRFQGVAHFDLIQQDVLQAFGYQATVEPQRLESGLFPGVLAPRIREGTDSAVVLQPETDPHLDEPMESYSNTLDATDSVASVTGNGAGFQNGTTGQLQGSAFDPVTVANSLFDVQGWQDFSDASWASLLGALLLSDLGNRLTPWQTIQAIPKGLQRLVGVYPISLSGSTAKLRWRPGDGVRVRAQDVNIWDTTPRQLLQVQKSFSPRGLQSAAVTVASGPAAQLIYPQYSATRARSSAKTLKRQLYSATRWQRNYQRTQTELTGRYVEKVPIGPGATSGQSSIVSLNPGDIVVRSWVRVNVNSAGLSFDVVLNGTDVTTTLGGPWTTVPVPIILDPVVAPNANNELVVTLLNNGGSTGLFSWQTFVTVLR